MMEKCRNVMPESKHEWRQRSGVLLRNEELDKKAREHVQANLSSLAPNEDQLTQRGMKGESKGAGIGFHWWTKWFPSTLRLKISRCQGQKSEYLSHMHGSKVKAARGAGQVNWSSHWNQIPEVGVMLDVWSWQLPAHGVLMSVLWMWNQEESNISYYLEWQEVVHVHMGWNQRHKINEMVLEDHVVSTAGKGADWMCATLAMRIVWLSISYWRKAFFP